MNHSMLCMLGQSLRSGRQLPNPDRQVVTLHLETKGPKQKGLGSNFHTYFIDTGTFELFVSGSRLNLLRTSSFD